MNYSDKIKVMEEKIKKANVNIAKEQDKIKEWKKEIVEYENLEVQGLLKTHNISVTDLKEFLSSKNLNIPEGAE